ncbi:MAG: tetratricopeptide repeat protein [Bacteroidales bacterium]|nr:tetratricopeptide repeat protein [Bacteroidales bacterium]
MRKTSLLLFCILLGLAAYAQADRSQLRSGNRKYRRQNYREAEIDYRKALVKDSLSLAANYNLASDLFCQESYEEAEKYFDSATKLSEGSEYCADSWFNKGDNALKRQDYASAVEAFKQSLLLNPADIDAKENYIYAKLMLKNQQNQQNQQQDNQDNQKNQDNQNDQNNQDNKDKQNPPQDQPQDRQNRPQDSPQISPQQAQQMLRAIQAKEKETQEKVNKEKAEALKSRQKDKNW